MKLSEQWLREWVNPPLPIKTLTEQLTLAGLEVESIAPVSGSFSHVRVGQIIRVDPHPNASRLQICQVDCGEQPPLSIVCGAANARDDLKVAVACVGALLPSDIHIEEVALRGVLSQGMLCSSKELGLSNESQGILELPSDAPIGKDLRDYLQLDDHIIDIRLTPNRGDCLSIKGLARELSALTKESLNLPLQKCRAVDIPDTFPIIVESPDDCPHYLGRIIRGINQQAKTPLWMCERLRRSGFRSIHPVVDVTNYVMLERGQPLHAFDLARLNSEIMVRHARKNETLVLLDGKEVRLNEKTLVIADKTQVHAIAGIMGGHYSAVSQATNDIFLESAFFNPDSLAGQSRYYGLNSESGYRFERGVDPHLTLEALERATQLLIEIVGGKSGSLIEVGSEKKQHPPIHLRQSRIKKLLGISLTETEIETILLRLGMRLIRADTEEITWTVTPPTWRFDINLEVDLIEELARVHGYSKISARSARSELHFLDYSESSIPLARIQTLLVDRDYQEAITYSFISPELQKSIDPDEVPLTLINPLSCELSVMRSSLWPGLLNAAIYNQKRQQSRLRLFETGFCFHRYKDEIRQEPYLAALAMGDTQPEQWGMPKKPLDFFTVKSDIEALFRLSGNLSSLQFIPEEHPALHPGQSSKIKLGKKEIGYFGALHPSLLTKLDLTGPVFLFQLSLDTLTKTNPPYFKDFSKFPIIRRDISFWVEKLISAHTILAKAKASAGTWLKDCYLFDVYDDKKIEKEKRSLAMALLWQHPSRTLTDKEVDDLLKKVTADLKHYFAIQRRE